MGAEIVWEAILDDRYEVRVERTGDYTAQLVISEIENEPEGGRELLREDTTLAYRAIFGPDVADIANWQTRACKFIDEELPKK